MKAKTYQEIANMFITSGKSKVIEDGGSDFTGKVCECGSPMVWCSADSVEDDNGKPYGWWNIEACSVCGKETGEKKWIAYTESAS